MTPDPTQRDARDAELAALREAENDAFWAMRGYILSYAVARERDNDRTTDAAMKRIVDGLDAYRDAVAARVRAELLQSGTPVWVARDGESMVSSLHTIEPHPIEARYGERVFRAWPVSRGALYIDHVVTPPGTCVEARVVLVPGGGNG